MINLAYHPIDPSPSSPSPSPLTEHDPLGSSDYIQVYNHHQADQQEDCSDEIDSTTDLDDPFQNVSTPDSLAADFDSDTGSHHHHQQQPSDNNTLLSHQRAQILTTTLDLKLNHHLQPSSPTNQPNLHLDLSCVNSDDTDASITSLFSFPDPLNSTDQIIPSTRSDQYDSDWLERSPNRASELASSSPHSDHHTSLTSDQLDFKSSRSPSLTDADLQTHTSFSSPTSPLFHTAAGSDLSHRLHVFLCGHQISHSQSIEILSNLRMNFSQFDFLAPNPTLAPSQGAIDWKWPTISLLSPGTINVPSCHPPRKYRL
ncbi:uncharacterized protein PGTG_01950 [Puccinia graminis f. sp. tritici CRL 75-36-700-3]|uniref:Uncharacterized protein n=1 Tax=Puccinia graminis f. sp. tritici (strain CRL 75-36-700-3 / race SCCL) TaxID=418459 RepID=E3JT78_PUCGT|nr:uncharacterized protein PGTG_01950 [Puccinia graminis f. sp. tritici CRL 75-36-700-3]EFP75357.2 hypothetical protein PGTG_01950 [Puccinia graminis f. sp. tritici CRL 75-36-700-3]